MGFKRGEFLFTFIISFVMLFSLNIVYAEEIDISNTNFLPDNNFLKYFFGFR